MPPLTAWLGQTPPSLQQLLNATGVVHEQVILITVIIEPVPRTESNDRMDLMTLGEGFHRLVLRYGFMQGPNVPSDLAACAAKCGLELDGGQLRYFIGHVELLAGRKTQGMAVWRDRLFSRMAANTQDPTAACQVPAGQVTRIGLQLGI